MIDAATAAQKWAQNLGSAGPAYTAGINAVTTSPMEAAAANEQGYIQGVQNAVSSGKWASGLRRTSLQAWKNQCTQVGASRLASGATAAKPKVQAFLTNFLPFLQNVTSQTKSMPNVTLQDRINRMVAQANGVAQYKRGG